MPRLIDAEALREKAYSVHIPGEDTLVVEIADIDAAPTIDAVPVVRGEWMHGTVTRDEAVACSACDAVEFITSPFCRECGAKMRGGANTEAG